MRIEIENKNLSWKRSLGYELCTRIDSERCVMPRNTAGRLMNKSPMFESLQGRRANWLVLDGDALGVLGLKNIVTVLAAKVT